MCTNYPASDALTVLFTLTVPLALTLLILQCCSALRHSFALYALSTWSVCGWRRCTHLVVRCMVNWAMVTVTALQSRGEWLLGSKAVAAELRMVAGE